MTDSHRACAAQGAPSARALQADRLRPSCAGQDELPVQQDIPLPGELRRLQGSHLFAALLELTGKRIAQALSSQLPVFAIDEGRRMEFMGVISWVADYSTKSLKQEIKDEDGEWRDSGQEFDIQSALDSADWIDHVIAPVLAEARAQIGWSATNEALFKWLKQNLQHRFQNARWLGPVRRQVFRHCQVIPGLHLVVTAADLSASPVRLSSKTYSEFWADAPVWSELLTKSPDLIHFFYWFTKWFDLPVGTGLGPLREACIGGGWTPATWRFVARHGRSCYEAFWDPADSRDPGMLNTLAFIDMQTRAGLRRPLPSRLAEVLGKLLRTIDASSLPVDPRILRAGMKRWAQLRATGEEQSFAETEWLEMLMWMREEQPVLDKNQWRAGWKAIRRRFLLTRKDARGRPQWASPLAEFVVGRWKVVPLLTELSLAQEGLAMKNCCGDMASDCKSGIYRFFSVLERDCHTRQATVGLRKRGGKWTLAAVKGKCNSDVGFEMKEIARMTCEQSNGKVMPYPIPEISFE